MENKIISLKKYQKNKKTEPKMLLIIILFSIISGALVWDYYIEQKAATDVEIPASDNISYNNRSPIASTTTEINAQFEDNQGRPILLYVYTSWCGTCKKNFKNINEIAREFQNTDLKVVTIAIDRDMTAQKLSNYLDSYGDLYFEPRFLASKEGFSNFLKQKGVKYKGVIPFTALISKQGRVKVKFNGIKRGNYLRNKIIRELYS